MTTPISTTLDSAGGRPSLAQLATRPGRASVTLFVCLLLGGLVYTAWSLFRDIDAAGTVKQICGCFINSATNFNNNFHSKQRN